MIKAVFFDFDGVLVESVDIKTEAFAKLFESEGRSVVDDVRGYHLNNTGVSRFEKFRYIYQNILQRPLSKDRFDELCDEFAKLVVDAVVRAPYVKGAKEFLDANSLKYKCYVTSATPQKEIEEILKCRGMDSYFVRVYGAPMKKINAVKDALDKEDLNPAEAVYIGDALSDLDAAGKNAVKFIARINDNESLFGDMECLKISDLTELSPLIKRL